MLWALYLIGVLAMHWTRQPTTDAIRADCSEENGPSSASTHAIYG